MIKIPEALRRQYDHLLVKGHVTLKEDTVYKKWLQFYPDFCKQYNRPTQPPHLYFHRAKNGKGYLRRLRFQEMSVFI